MNFNFANWHLVPKDATIPAGTPYWRFCTKINAGSYSGSGLVAYDLIPTGRLPEWDYYTKEPILPPAEAAQEERAQKMFRMFWGSLDYRWEYEDDFVQDKWRNLAAKYVEKED